MADKANFLDRFMAPIIVGLVVVGGVMAITMCNGEIIIFVDFISIGVVFFGSVLVMSLVGHAAPRQEVLDRFWTLPIWIGMALSLIQIQIGLANLDDAGSLIGSLRYALVPLLYGVVFGACILKPIAIHETWRNPPGDGKQGASGFISLHIVGGLLLAMLINFGMMALMFLGLTFHQMVSR